MSSYDFNCIAMQRKQNVFTNLNETSRYGYKLTKQRKYKVFVIFLLIDTHHTLFLPFTMYGFCSNFNKIKNVFIRTAIIKIESHKSLQLAIKIFANNKKSTTSQNKQF